ncbi:MAG: two-component system response regulator [Gammaproteobacteria bacterium]|nr:MAG: two-component system response regulator [Gammaproteobacteria bacterium]
MPNHHFLVVDDATFIRNMVIKSVLEQFPESTFSEAPNGVDAQGILEQSNDIDLILCDWEMPEMDGKELLDWVKGNETTQEIPFIMVTSRGDKSFIIEAAKAGVSNYLVKPFSKDKLIGKIQTVLDGNNEPPALTSIPSSETNSQAQKPTSGATNAALTQGTSTPPKKASSKKGSLQPSTKNKKPANKGKAFIRFQDGRNEASIRELSLKGISAAMDFTEKMPGILEAVVVDIEANKSDKIAVSMNGYIFSLEAAESKPDAKIINLSIIFLDKDTGKMDALSKLIARGSSA